MNKTGLFSNVLLLEFGKQLIVAWNDNGQFILN